MKFYYRLLCIAAVMISAVACKTVEEENFLPIDGIANGEKGVFCYFPPIEAEEPDTKGVTAGDSFSATFDNEDQITIWSEAKTVCFYTLTQISENAASARFDGGGYALTDDETYTSLYPAMATLKYDNVPLTYLGQVQSANGDASHIKDYLYAWAKGTCTDGTTSFGYAYNSGFIRFTLTFPAAATINTVKLVADSDVFATAPTLNAGTGELTKGTLTNEISITLQNGFAVEADGTIVVYMAAAPFAAANMTVQAIDSNNVLYTSPSSSISELQPGKYKRLARTMGTDFKVHSTSDQPNKYDFDVDVENLYVTIVKESSESTHAALTIEADTTPYPKNVYITIDEACTLSETTLNINMPNSHVELISYSTENIGAINATTSLNTLVLGKNVSVGTVNVVKGSLTVDGTATTVNIPMGSATDQTQPNMIIVTINGTATTVNANETNCNLYVAGTANVGTVTTHANNNSIDGTVGTFTADGENVVAFVSEEAEITTATTADNGALIYVEDENGSNLGTQTEVNNGDIVLGTTPVAKIGNVTYLTLAGAVDAVPTDGTETTITMIADATVDNYITISANKNVVIELNGKTISSSVAQTKSSQLFLNRGTLTIQDNTDTQKDGTGHGKITYINSTPDSQTNYASNTITNNGVLTVKSGYIDNLCSGSQVAYTIDNQTNGGSYTPIFNFEGGKIYNNCTDAVRMFLNSTTKLNTVNISGGVIDSEKEGRIVCMQNANDKLNKGELNITGGVVTKSVGGWSYIEPNYEYSDEQYGAISINISGGRMHEFITTYMPKTAARADALRVIGGTFEVDPSDYVSAGYEAYQDGDVWKIREVQGVAQIGQNTYPTLAEAFQAVGEGQTITILTDIDFSQPDYSGYKWAGSVYNPLELCKNGVTIDLDGHTFSNMGNCAIAIGHLLANGGRISNLTIKNGTMLAGKTDNVTNSYVLLIAGVDNMTIKNITTNGGINVCSGSTGVVIENCTINGTKYYTVCAQTGSQVTIKGTTYTKNTDATVANKSMFWIQGASTDSDMVTSTNPTGAFGASSITIEDGTYTVDFTNGGVFYLTSGVAPSLKGGTYNFNANAYCAPGYEAVDNGNGTWTVSEIQGVAQIGSTRYASLAEAIAAVQSNETITLIKDIALSSTEEYEGKDFVLNGDGHIINSAAAITTTTYPLAFGDANFAISNATFTSQWTTENKQNYNVLVYASSKETTALLSNVSISSNQQTALCVQGYNSNITTVTLENLTITNTGTRTGSDAYRSAAVATAFGGKVIINSGTYSSEVQAVRQFSSGGDITINGGTFSGKIVAHLDKGSYSQYPAIITINGGTFNNCSFEVIHNNGDTSANIVIYGGTFDADPSAYVAEGYIAVYSATTHKYTVEAAQYWEAEAVSDEAFAAITDETNKIISISTAAQLAKLAKNVNAHVPLTEGFTYKGYTVKLEADINLAGKIWTPIGVCEDWTRGHFSGTFDGQGHTISNLKVVREDRAGLFGSIYGEAVIKDLNVTNVTLIANHFAAGIVGWINEENYDLVVDNCSVIGGVITVVPNFVNNEWDNGDKCGGVVGYSNQNTANHCKITNNTAENLTITAYRDCGGIVGFCSGNVLVSGNKAKNVTLVQDNFRGYQSSVTTVQQIVGRNGNGGSTQENNTATGVVINTVN